MTCRDIEAQPWKRRRVRVWRATPAERSRAVVREIVRMTPREDLVRQVWEALAFRKELWASYWDARRGKG